MSKIGVYPPTGQTGELVDKLSDLPHNNHWIVDYNEFYRLYQDEDDILYVYRVKQPDSPLNERIQAEIQQGTTSVGTINKDVQ